jgi:ribosomal protein S17E
MADCVSKERRRELNRRWKEAHPGYMLEWQRRNRDKTRAYSKKYYNNGKQDYEQVKENVNRYHRTPKGRAQNLLTSYRQFDVRKGMECDLTAEYIERVITTEHCVWCGESDWHVLGLDRIRNDRPHAFGNVMCSCRSCNVKRAQRTILENLRERIGLKLDEWVENNKELLPENIKSII